MTCCQHRISHKDMYIIRIQRILINRRAGRIDERSWIVVHYQYAEQFDVMLSQMHLMLSVSWKSSRRCLQGIRLDPS
jgi:hypothetical protein